MNDRLRYRGPDDSGTWADPESGVALGHRRLSILDLSPEGHQPMHSADGRFVMVYNGEIYNYLSTRQELQRLGYQFRGHSDTEVMLAAFCEWGVHASLERFNGMFSLAAWDTRERTLYLSRDRVGKKPLYYGWCGHHLLFGSELKALQAHPAFDAPIDRESLPYYLRLGYITAPRSIYKGISKLPPGTLLTLRPDHLRSRQTPEPKAYWSARTAIQSSQTNPFRGSETEAVEELNNLLLDSVRIRMISDVPLGAFLSGGIDSSVVVALMHAASGKPAQTFSIGFHEREYNEAEHAKAVARHLGSDHTEMYVSPEESMGVIPTLPAMYDEPFADSSQIPTFLVSKLARQKVTVSLSGDGGDEFFGGYSQYFSHLRFFQKYGQMPGPLRGMMSAGMSFAASVLPNSSSLSGRLSKLSSSLTFRSPEEISYRVDSNWHQPNDLVPGVREPLNPFVDPSVALNNLSFFERIMYLDTITYLPDDILVKVDRASMAVSLEARCPILDYRVFELAWRLPFDMKVRDGRGKWVLRQVLEKYVPRELIDRPKKGFAVPIGTWLRKPLRDWAESLINTAELQNAGLFEATPVRNAWEAHLRGEKNNSALLWIILMAQAWVAEARSTQTCTI